MASLIHWSIVVPQPSTSAHHFISCGGPARLTSRA
jgi:hypothetical protein